MKLVIPRDKWGRRRLWDLEKDCGCALGHLAIACGVPKEKLYDRAYFSDIPIDYIPTELIQGGFVTVDELGHAGQTSKAHDVVVANDRDYDEPGREERVTKAFAVLGIECSFA